MRHNFGFPLSRIVYFWWPLCVAQSVKYCQKNRTGTRYGTLTTSKKRHSLSGAHGKNHFVTATKLGTTNEFFVASTKNFAAATKRFVDRTKHFVVVTKYFCYPYFNKWLCWYNKIFFFPCGSTGPCFVRVDAWEDIKRIRGYHRRIICYYGYPW